MANATERTVMQGFAPGMPSDVERSRSVHELVAECARRNLAILSRDALIGCGLSPQTIRRWRQKGLLDELYPSVFTPTTSSLSWEQRLMGALVWAGKSACVSHRAAAALLRLDGYPPGIIEITTTSRKKPPAGVIVHSVHRMSLHDVAREAP